MLIQYRVLSALICEAICERPRQTKRQMTPNEKANVTSPMTPIKYRETPKSSGPSEGHHLPSSSWSSTHVAHVAYNHAKFSMVLCMHFEDFRFGAQSNLWFGNEMHGFLLFFMCLKHGKAASCISSWSWYLQPLHINSINRYQLLELFKCLKPTFRIQTYAYLRTHEPRIDFSKDSIAIFQFNTPFDGPV